VSAPGPIPHKRFAGLKEGGKRRLSKPRAAVRENPVDILDARIPDRKLDIDDRIDQRRTSNCGNVELMKRPGRAVRVVRRNVEEDIRIDERHQGSPRVNAMISSVVSLLVAVPRIRSKRLGSTIGLPTRRRKARPSSAISKSTLLPGLMPRRSRTGFGMVTWPLRVTVTATSVLRNTGDLQGISLQLRGPWTSRLRRVSAARGGRLDGFRRERSARTSAIKTSHSRERWTGRVGHASEPITACLTLRGGRRGLKPALALADAGSTTAEPSRPA